MICEVVEGAGGHIGVASCATHTCSAAIEHSHFQKKCLQFASWNALYTLTFVMIFWIFLGILWGNDKHKYLGRTACGNWRRRGFVQLQRKIRTGRTTFQNYRQILTNKHIALELTVEFTVQLPLLQLTYVKYMKVHDTKQQLQGFPIFRRGAK